MNKWGMGLALLLTLTNALVKDIQLLNVLYGPTHELYGQYNKASDVHWKQETGSNVVTRQSHGNPGKQATSIVNGIGADVVTLTLAYDVDATAERGHIDKNWIKRLPDNSAPYTSTIVFLVCEDDPKQIHDWSDLIKSGMSVVMPNPKSSGGAHRSYPTAWGYALHHNNNDQAKAQDSVKALYKNVEVFDSGARGPTNTFAEHGIGNVPIVWEDEALLAANELGKDKSEIVTPSESILAEPTVSMVDKVIEKRDAKAMVEIYPEYLYSPEGREIAVKNYCRPRDADVVKKYENVFLRLRLSTIDEEFGGWTKAQKEHFSDGDTFDQIGKR